MSCNYADGLSPYENKGKLGTKEIFDPDHVVKEKVKSLAEWINSSKYVVFHTGAGISTSAGIPDFRGPNGVWTLEAKGEKPNIDISFDDAIPTKTHMAIVKLVNSGIIKYIVSQNIDGLHLKSGLSRENLSELHGNMYVEECKTCFRQFVMKTATKSVGQKCLGRRCPSTARRRPCRGKTYDTILDWEAGLPEDDLNMAYYHSAVADLNICLGTTLQINPSGNLPLNGKKIGDAKLVICNLQPTKHDKKADLIINTYVDDMMVLLMGMLDLKIDEYSAEFNPICQDSVFEWTISESKLKEMKALYQQALKEGKNATKRRLSNKIKNELNIEVYKIPKSEFDSFSSISNIKKEIKSETLEDVDNPEVESENLVNKTVINDESTVKNVSNRPNDDDKIDSGFSETPEEI